MNGAPLPHWNEFPARLGVPGWTGTYWAKQLSTVDVLSKPETNFWMRTACRLPRGMFKTPTFVSQATSAIEPFSTIVVNSLITSLQSGQQIARTTPVQGFAQSFRFLISWAALWPAPTMRMNAPCGICARGDFDAIGGSTPLGIEPAIRAAGLRIRRGAEIGREERCPNANVAAEPNSLSCGRGEYLDLGLIGDLERIVDLYSEISNGAFECYDQAEVESLRGSSSACKSKSPSSDAKSVRCERSDRGRSQEPIDAPSGRFVALRYAAT
ncbi:sulfite:cytochrome c oxidoreductase subunit A [Caballeronia calidae]|uniref:Sulfite:cytochrome c oxidoreductase subunit A n=1 Tax=Caballeronia calidae TaxID=1777139 RepID=A0A158CJC5_9BURK|nr:sulfite:cytochrome c oxidoreductase subunit A [Caballeronia calidae]